MEHQIVTPDNKNYPGKLIHRLSENTLKKLYYNGPLDLLDNFTLAVISADSIGGVAMMAANQVLFTIREYAMNYVGPWHSVMEFEMFRLGLWRKCQNTLTLFSVKGLGIETHESFLLDRAYPPLDDFPERDEYFRRANSGELLMLSIFEPETRKQIRTNIIERNWIACNLGDVVFVPYAVKGSKTFTMAKRVHAAGIPIFTTGSNENKDLHEIGIQALSRETTGIFLEKIGAKKINNGGPTEGPIKSEVLSIHKNYKFNQTQIEMKL